MSSIFTILMVVVLFACLAMLYSEGIWSNAIRLINVVTAGLLAVNFFEPAAAFLDDWQPWDGWDFLALWVLFSFSYAILCTLTDQVSKVKVRFLSLADKIGGAVLALWIGWIMLCFTVMTLHTAPLARNFLFGAFSSKSDERMFLGLAPDRQWLGFVQNQSLGAFSRMATPEEWKQETFIFDPQAKFMPKYASRRSNIEKGGSKQ
jgi:hypothetical protein